MEGLSLQQRQEVLEWLKHHVPQPRIQHILRVEEMAIALAQRHHVSTSKAAQAGLMHDLAKYFAPERLIAIAHQHSIEIDPVAEANPHLLHAEVSAVVAKDQFGVTDPDVLAAIANHTLGRPAMNDLSCIVFLADTLEPGRGQKPPLQKLRDLSTENLSAAVWQTCDYTLEKLISRDRLIHPRAVMTRNWFLQSTKQQNQSPEDPLQYTTSVNFQ